MVEDLLLRVGRSIELQAARNEEVGVPAQLGLGGAGCRGIVDDHFDVRPVVSRPLQRDRRVEVRISFGTDLVLDQLFVSRLFDATRHDCLVGHVESPHRHSRPPPSRCAESISMCRYTMSPVISLDERWRLTVVVVWCSESPRGALGIGSNLTLVIHDWGSALGFRWAHDHEHDVKAKNPPHRTDNSTEPESDGRQDYRFGYPQAVAATARPRFRRRG